LKPLKFRRPLRGLTLFIKPVQTTLTFAIASNNYWTCKGNITSGEDQAADLTGQTIGRYHLVRLLGSGGMGDVYLAEQKSPIRRRVAVKVIKLGLDTKSFIARFAAERQALAVMDHRGITKVFVHRSATSDFSRVVQLDPACPSERPDPS